MPPRLVFASIRNFAFSHWRAMLIVTAILLLFVSLSSDIATQFRAVPATIIVSGYGPPKAPHRAQLTVHVKSIDRRAGLATLDVVVDVWGRTMWRGPQDSIRSLILTLDASDSRDILRASSPFSAEMRDQHT